MLASTICPPRTMPPLGRKILIETVKQLLDQPGGPVSRGTATGSGRPESCMSFASASNKRGEIPEGTIRTSQ
jgi:hypothetical protein